MLHSNSIPSSPSEQADLPDSTTSDGFMHQVPVKFDADATVYESGQPEMVETDRGPKVPGQSGVPVSEDSKGEGEKMEDRDDWEEEEEEVLNLPDDNVFGRLGGLTDEDWEDLRQESRDSGSQCFFLITLQEKHSLSIQFFVDYIYWIFCILE